jgi:putative ABC transport system permease protein
MGKGVFDARVDRPRMPPVRRGTCTSRSRYVVNVRRREVGLRLVLGAARSAIIRPFLVQGLRVAGLACICGVVLSLAFTRVLSSMLYGVSASDPVALSSVIAIMLVVAGLAALVPATRAALVEPMRVLRDE